MSDYRHLSDIVPVIWLVVWMRDINPFNSSQQPSFESTLRG